MTIPALVLTVRSLRVEARSGMAYVLRTALVLFVLGAIVTGHWTSTLFGAPGLQLMKSIVHIDFFFISVVGLVVFSSAITEEKEEQTLGLLRMSGLNPISLVLGKSAGRVASGLMLLAVQVPFTMLAITLGGVSLGQVLSAYLVLASYMLFVCGLALVGSVVCRRTTQASLLTLLGLLLFFFGPLIQYGVVNELVRKGSLSRGDLVVTSSLWIHEQFANASALGALQATMVTGFEFSEIRFPVVSNLVLSGVFFLVAWLCFNPFNREERVASAARGIPGPGAARFWRLQAGRVWPRAILWKEFHFTGGGVNAILIKLVVLGAAVGMVKWTWSDLDRETVGLIVMWMMFILLFVDAALIAGRMFRDEVTWQTLWSLTLLPAPLWRWAYGKVLGCLPALLPVVLYLGLGFLLAGDERREVLKAFDEPVFWYMVSLGVLLVHATAYVSLWLRRGAFAVVLGGLVLQYWFLLGLIGVFVMMLTRSAEVMESMILVLALVFLGLSALLHPLIGRRLRTLAAR